jgi:hypothetical protein
MRNLELRFRTLTSGTLLAKLTLHRRQRIALFLQSVGKPHDLLSLLLSLSEARLRVLQCPALTLSVNLRVGEGGVL